MSVLSRPGKLAIAAVLMAGVAGCGSSGGGPADDEAAENTRSIVHALGTTDVPADPQRVVVLDTDKLDTLLTLGVTPVGAALPGESDSMPAYLGDEFADVEVVGTLQEPDLEAIAELNPDLILGSKFRQEKFYDKLAGIAPTVFTDLVGITWKDNFLLDGDALGKGDLAKEKLADFERRATEFGQSLGDPAAIEVSIVRFRPEEIRLYGPDSFVGIVLGDVGLGRPVLQQLADAEDKRFAPVSEERINEADGDVLFYSAFGDTAAGQQQTVTSGALWQGLGAVQAGKAFEVDDEIWFTGIGVTAATQILDDLDTHLSVN